MTVPFQGYQDWQPRVSPQSEDDLLYSNTNLPNGSPQSFTVTLNSKYVGIAVVIESPNFQNDMQVVVANQGTLKSQYQQAQILGAGVPGTFLFPMINFIGDTVKVTIVFTAALTGGSILIFGARDMPGLQVRPDGRMYPQGAVFADSFQNAVAGNFTIAGAPAAPSRFLILSAYLAGFGPNGALVAIFATINGANVHLLGVGYGPNSGGANSQTWPQGVLCDPGTDITGNNFNVSTSLSGVTYDVVV